MSAVTRLVTANLPERLRKLLVGLLGKSKPTVLKRRPAGVPSRRVAPRNWGTRVSSVSRTYWPGLSTRRLPDASSVYVPSRHIWMTFLRRRAWPAASTWMSKRRVSGDLTGVVAVGSEARVSETALMETAPLQRPAWVVDAAEASPSFFDEAATTVSFSACTGIRRRVPRPSVICRSEEKVEAVSL